LNRKRKLSTFALLSGKKQRWSKNKPKTTFTMSKSGEICRESQRKKARKSFIGSNSRVLKLICNNFIGKMT
jgi:hypothetical protein